jgi:hypothetical protein
MWISFSEIGREKSLLDGFSFAGFDPRFDGIFDAFGAVFNGIVVPHNPIKSGRYGGADPC